MQRLRPILKTFQISQMLDIGFSTQKLLSFLASDIIMQILEKLFGSAARVKVLRLFLLSPNKVFAQKEAAMVLRVFKKSVSKEIRFLSAIGFLKRAIRVDAGDVKRGKKIKVVKIKIAGFRLSPTFPFILALRNLLITASPISREKMLDFFKSRGQIKLVALGGIFSEVFNVETPEIEADAKLDLVVVGALKKNKVEGFVKNLESEIGKELNWTLLTQSEFEHRMSMQDKLLRDLFDYPHEFLINKLGLE